MDKETLFITIIAFSFACNIIAGLICIGGITFGWKTSGPAGLAARLLIYAGVVFLTLAFITLIWS